ncbi:MAG: hypothetical protein METHP_00769 [Methanoregula sp. SKADARSKE-2]|nr:MAG: hypothetical protein METHP_00769 [Methanoregula sp. SKADARSKE-2]
MSSDLRVSLPFGSMMALCILQRSAGCGFKTVTLSVAGKNLISGMRVRKGCLE